MLGRDYKFYLAFENSNCKNYVTEKFFDIALANDVLPIAMGAPADDYKQFAPAHSFIHVDDYESPKKLAEYLHTLNNNDSLYNSYFQWKETGTIGHPIRRYMCELCAMMHDEQIISNHTWYDDINEWWDGPGICTKDTHWHK